MSLADLILDRNMRYRQGCGVHRHYLYVHMTIPLQNDILSTASIDYTKEE